MYECAAILGKRTGQVGTEYLVRWAGYELSDNSWEPVEQLSNAADKMKELAPIGEEPMMEASGPSSGSGGARPQSPGERAPFRKQAGRP